MTRAKIPDTCDLHGGEITTEKQYCFEVYEGRTSFSRGDQTKATNMDVCHKCFLDICKQGYKPNWKTTIINPNWERGAKKGSGKEYRIAKPETDVHINQQIGQEEITA